MNTTGRSLVTLGLVVYLSCFSAFALYHVYAENELVDSHGCQIGEWVMHAQVTLFFVVLVSAVPAPVLFSVSIPNMFHPKPFHHTASLRGPPRLALL